MKARCRLPRPREAFDLGWIASFRSLANQAAQVSLVSGDATVHEDSVLSVDVDDVDAAYALAQATGLLPDYDKCQAYIARRAQRLPFRKLIALPGDAVRACRPHGVGLGG